MNYRIYFSIYDKKMQATISAASRDDAEYRLRGKIQVDKIVEIPDSKPTESKEVRDIMDMLGMS